MLMRENHKGTSLLPQLGSEVPEKKEQGRIMAIYLHLNPVFERPCSTLHQFRISLFTDRVAALGIPGTLLPSRGQSNRCLLSNDAEVFRLPSILSQTINIRHFSNSYPPKRVWRSVNGNKHQSHRDRIKIPLPRRNLQQNYFQLANESRFHRRENRRSRQADRSHQLHTKHNEFCQSS